MHRLGFSGTVAPAFLHTHPLTCVPRIRCSRRLPLAVERIGNLLDGQPVASQVALHRQHGEVVGAFKLTAASPDATSMCAASTTPSSVPASGQSGEARFVDRVPHTAAMQRVQ